MPTRTIKKKSVSSTKKSALPKSVKFHFGEDVKKSLAALSHDIKEYTKAQAKILTECAIAKGKAAGKAACSYALRKASEGASAAVHQIQLLVVETLIPYIDKHVVTPQKRAEVKEILRKIALATSVTLLLSGLLSLSAAVPEIRSNIEQIATDIEKLGCILNPGDLVCLAKGY